MTGAGEALDVGVEVVGAVEPVDAVDAAVPGLPLAGEDFLELGVGGEDDDAGVAWGAGGQKIA